MDINAHVNLANEKKHIATLVYGLPLNLYQHLRPEAEIAQIFVSELHWH